MKKLTLVSVYANGRRLSLFVNALYENGKAVVSQNLIEKMLRKMGICERGMTFSIS
jgi:hypothetical protein